MTSILGVLFLDAIVILSKTLYILIPILLLKLPEGSTKYHDSGKDLEPVRNPVLVSPGITKPDMYQ